MCQVLHSTEEVYAFMATCHAALDLELKQQPDQQAEHVCFQHFSAQAGVVMSR